MKARPALAALALVAAARCAFAQEVAGTHTLGLEQSGARDGVGAPRSLDPRGFAALDLTMGWKPRDFVSWSLALALRADDLSSDSRGASLGSFTLRHQNGAADLPYRIEAGDFRALTTSLSSTRSLKGVSLEVQPFDRGGGILHSLLAFAGKNESEWRDLQPGDDRSIGFSWVAQPIGGHGVHAGLHVVRQSLAAREGAPRGREQTVASVSAKRPFDLGGWRWALEGELAAIRGDGPDTAANGGVQESDSAVYLKLEGRHPLGMRFLSRLENNGPDYRLLSGGVKPDRRDVLNKLSWSGAPGSLELRHQATRTEVHAERPRAEHTRGMTVTLGVPSLAGKFRADGWRRTARRGVGEAATQERVEASLEMPFAGSTVKASVAMQDDDNLFRDSDDRRSRDLALRFPHEFAALGWTVTLTPEVTRQRIRAPAFTERKTIAGGDIAFERPGHRLVLNVNGHSVHPSHDMLPDVASVGSAIQYTYKRGRHTFVAGYGVDEARARPGVDTRNYKSSLTWSIDLDRTAAPPFRAMGLPMTPSHGFAALDVMPRDGGALRAVPLGIERGPVLSSLAAAFGPASVLGNVWVYDAPLLAIAPGPQRLAVVTNASDQSVERVVLLVPLENASASEAARAYDYVLREMIERFGRPDTARQEGVLRDSYASDIASGRLVRYAEWRLADGVVRAGMPRRLDRTPRIEVHRASRLPPAHELSWGLPLLP